MNPYESYQHNMPTRMREIAECTEKAEADRRRAEIYACCQAGVRHMWTQYSRVLAGLPFSVDTLADVMTDFLLRKR
jgi:hypothetical protein